MIVPVIVIDLLEGSQRRVEHVTLRAITRKLSIKRFLYGSKPHHTEKVEVSSYSRLVELILDATNSREED